MNLTSKQSGKHSDFLMEMRVRGGGGPSLYRTQSVLCGVGGSVDRVAGLIYDQAMCDGVRYSGRLTDHRMNELCV